MESDIMATKIVIDCKTGKETIEEYNYVPPSTPANTTLHSIDLKDMKKLADNAKAKGEI
jgi:hypothetical protein